MVSSRSVKEPSVCRAVARTLYSTQMLLLPLVDNLCLAPSPPLILKVHPECATTFGTIQY